MKKADWILIIALIGMAVILAIVVYCQKQQYSDISNTSVVVEVDGKIYHTIPMNQDGKYAIATKDGDSVLVIAKGECYMDSAHCPDQICVKHKHISAVGESIICLPYKIVVSVVGNEASEYDN